MKYTTTTYTLLMIVAMALLSSCSKYYVNQGDRYYESLAYYRAASSYEKALAKSKKPNEKVLLNLAECYRANNDYKKAEDTYSKIVSGGNTDGKVLLNYAKVLMNNGKYDEALIQFKNYSKQFPTDNAVSEIIRSIEERETFMQDPEQWDVKQLPINAFEEFHSPAKYKDGYVFTATSSIKGKNMNPATGKAYYDLYYFKLDKNGIWSNPEQLKGSISGKLHDGMAAFAPGGNEVYYTTTNDEGLKGEARFEQIIGLKIQKDTLVNGKWQKAKMEFPYNSKEYSTGHPFLTADGKTMYFVSDMPGGKGGSDIYVTRWKNGAWSQPENLGGGINTAENELFPSADSLGNLYFSSFGHRTLGGLDVFYSENRNGTFQKAENLNYPLNSSKDDFAFLINNDGKTGFVSSNRSGSDKTYEFTRNIARIKIMGVITNKGDGKPLEGVKIHIKNLTNNEVDSVFTDAEGKYEYMLPGNSDYVFTLTKEGFFTQTEEITSKNQPPTIVRNFELQELVIDKPVVIDTQDDPNKPRPIFFDFDKSNIRPDAVEPLNKLAKLLKDNPKVTIELSSHTDSRGSDGYNQALSNRRANATKKYLVDKGIAAKRITAKGYGEKKLVNNCKDGVKCSEEEHQQNRRSEFKVISIEK
jgi:peptidoglycan-associated lipoprotein